MNLKTFLSAPNTKKLLSSIILPVLTGIFAGLLTRNSMQTFSVLNKPPFAPPAILFPIVWTILYILMGISFYLIQTNRNNQKNCSNASSLYYYQLAVNFLWSIFFFRLEWYLFSFLWLLLLWVLVFLMIRCFSKISKLASWLNVPYLLWITFAGYLNFAIWWLNR